MFQRGQSEISDVNLVTALRMVAKCPGAAEVLEDVESRPILDSLIADVT